MKNVMTSTTQKLAVIASCAVLFAATDAATRMTIDFECRLSDIALASVAGAVLPALCGEVNRRRHWLTVTNLALLGIVGLLTMVTLSPESVSQIPVVLTWTHTATVLVTIAWLSGRSKSMAT